MINSMMIDDNLQSNIVEDNDKSDKMKLNVIINSALNIPSNNVDNDIESIDVITDQLCLNENMNDIDIVSSFSYWYALEC